MPTVGLPTSSTVAFKDSPVIESIWPWFTSAMTIMPFLATSDFSASTTCSYDLLESTVTRVPAKVVSDAPTDAAYAVVARTARNTVANCLNLILISW